MIILTIRTDKPEAELALFDDKAKVQEIVWQAHRELAETIHLKIQAILTSEGKSLHDLGGIVVYQGPGSFTGLRIGLSVANALANALVIPMAVFSGGKSAEMAVQDLLSGNTQDIVLAEYGAPVRITKPKK